MLSLLVSLLVFALVCYLIFWILGYLGAPEPIRKVVTVIVVVIAVLARARSISQRVVAERK
jgi:hypothetical protein